jgi:hypothetical protein
LSHTFTALVPLLLLLHPLLEGLHQLVEAAEGLDLGLLLLGQELLGELLQPFRRDVRHQALIHLLQALEHVGEHAVELVEVALVLHQGRTGEVVEVVGGDADHALVHRLHQGEVFAQAHRHFGVAQFGEEAEEHGQVS